MLQADERPRLNYPSATVKADVSIQFGIALPLRFRVGRGRLALAVRSTR
jgi:hypothetical protein